LYATANSCWNYLYLVFTEACSGKSSVGRNLFYSSVPKCTTGTRLFVECSSLCRVHFFKHSAKNSLPSAALGKVLLSVTTTFTESRTLGIGIQSGAAETCVGPNPQVQEILKNCINRFQVSEGQSNQSTSRLAESRLKWRNFKQPINQPCHSC
jgi:hypothetical protein